MYGVWLGLRASAEIAPGLGVDGLFGYNLFDNFDRIRQGAASTLPHVRTDIRRYLQQREQWIERLQASYMFTPLEDVFMRASAGIIEQAYVGLSGELLYRPFGSRWAIGADLNWVRQRGFAQRFDLRDYQTLTGHVKPVLRGSLARPAGGGECRPLPRQGPGCHFLTVAVVRERCARRARSSPSPTRRPKTSA